MPRVALIALIASLRSSRAAPLVQADCVNKEYDQCGGKGFSGDTCCLSYDNCTFVNDYFSQCQPKDLCLNTMYGQCGGYDHHDPPRPWTPANHHQECCPDSFVCEVQNVYFSQCVFDPSNTTCAFAYQQCGGKGWTGKTCCVPGFECTPDPKSPEYYSGCTPLPICTNARYGQCGGVDPDGQPWDKEHDSCCPDGFKCSVVDAYFSQCVKNGTALVEAAAA